MCDIVRGMKLLIPHKHLQDSCLQITNCEDDREGDSAAGKRDKKAATCRILMKSHHYNNTIKPLRFQIDVSSDSERGMVMDGIAIDVIRPKVIEGEERSK